MGQYLYFTADSGEGGVRLWKAGSEGGVSPIEPATTPYSSPEWLTAAGDSLFFSARDFELGQELWATQDGSTAAIVADVHPGELWSAPAFLTAFGDAIYFQALDEHGRELWRSDGTAAGTKLAADILPDGDSFPQSLTVAGTSLYFTARAEAYANDLDLYRIENGSLEATKVVAMRSDRSFSSLEQPTPVGDLLFFRALSSSHGWELWRSDGSQEGTFMVGDLWFGRPWSFPRHLTEVGGNLFFAANDGAHGYEWWWTDGDVGSVHMIADINPGEGSSDARWTMSFNRWRPTSIDGVLYFVAKDGTHGRELWRSDGTEEGTWMVADIAPEDGSASPERLTAIGSMIYFTARDEIHGRELWRSDGTAEGTELLADINEGRRWSAPRGLTAVGGVLYFSARDGIHGREIWRQR